VRGDQRINCYIEASKMTNMTALDMTLIWVLTSDHHFGGMNEAMFIFPSMRAWVALRKVEAHRTGSTNLWTFWERKLVYETSARRENHTNVIYEVSTVIDDFAVQEFAEVIGYTSWQAVGDIGGFSYFMVFLQVLTMICVGIFLPNESNFLRGLGHSATGGGYEYGKLNNADDDLNERAPMLAQKN